MQAPCHAVFATVLAYRGDWSTAEETVAAAMDAAILLGSIEAAGTAMIASAAIAEARQDPARVIGALQTLPDTVPMLAPACLLATPHHCVDRRRPT